MIAQKQIQKYFSKMAHIQELLLEYLDADTNSKDDFNRFYDNISGSGIAKAKNPFFEFCQDFFRQWNHPNIIKIYGFYYGDKKHAPAILLEYCKFNLEKAINYLTDADIVGVIYEICTAMMHIHKMKIIHRDLKVANILIDKNKHVKICDFGISKVMSLTTSTSMTHDVGTLLYMAPELFQQDFAYNEKIDVYAFGVVLYFVLTKGQYPILCGPGNLEKAKIPKSINKISMSLIKNCWYSSPEKRPSFHSIIKFIEKYNFLMIDGIEDKIPTLKKHLGLK